MTDYRLHCFGQSGNAFKVALALELSSARWEPVFVDFFKGATRSAEFKALNPMGEVPVLEHDGRTMTQTGAILGYLTGTLGRFAPADAHEALRWILWDNHKLTNNMATWRFMTNFLPEDKRSADVIGFLKGRAVAALRVLDGHLSDREWIVGDALSTADLSCVGYMYYTDEYDLDWDEYPNVTAWRDRISALPGWRHPYDLMPGGPNRS